MRSLVLKARKDDHSHVSDAAGANRAGSGCSRLPLPDMTELNQVLSKQLEQNRTRRLTTEAREKLLKAALGLTRESLKAQFTAGHLTEADIVLSEKSN